MGSKGFKQHSKVVWPGYTEIEERHVAKVGRNQTCPCGSGKKYKECHEKDGTAFLEKLAREKDRRRVKQRRQALKDKGVPWYKRLFLRS
jgi:hypothetical protein